MHAGDLRSSNIAKSKLIKVVTRQIREGLVFSKNMHQRDCGNRDTSHHDHKLLHDCEIRVQTIAQEQEWIVFDQLVVLGDFDSQFVTDGAFQGEVESWLAFLEKAAAQEIQEWPGDSHGRLLKLVGFVNQLSRIVDLSLV